MARLIVRRSARERSVFIVKNSAYPLVSFIRHHCQKEQVVNDDSLDDKHDAHLAYKQ